MPEETAQLAPEIAGRLDQQVEGQPGAGRMTTLSRTLSSVLDVGRDLLARRRQSEPEVEPVNNSDALIKLCKALLEHRGEASGLALACEVVQGYESLPEAERLQFFMRLAHDFDVDRKAVLEAFDQYKVSGEPENLLMVNRALEAPRQKLFRRMNTAPEGTSTLVRMRGHLIDLLRAHPELRGVESDLKQLFISWFNKGFLELRKIDWTSSAAVLEKIIAYEAVHEINGWDDLRSRLGEDRRCFAFFHPALADDPLVFVEIALVDAIPSALAPLLQQDREVSLNNVNTVVFYSISNCHPGLAQISFGNFLIKSVVEALKKEIHTLDTFVTLSPVPGFRKWLLSADIDDLVPHQLADSVRQPIGQVVSAETYDALMKLCAHYLYNEKSGRLPKDPVARFHLGNGARLHGINGNADLSTKGRKQSAGIMVNYLYDLAQIEENHDAFFDAGRVAISKSVGKWLS